MKLKSFSAQASIAIENAKLFDEVLNVKNYSVIIELNVFSTSFRILNV